MNELNKYPKRSEDTASRVIDNEAVIVTPQEGLVRVLNDTGSRVWQLMDGKSALSDIIDTIAEEFEVTKDCAQEDVLRFIKELQTKNLVVINDEPDL